MPYYCCLINLVVRAVKLHEDSVRLLDCRVLGTVLDQKLCLTYYSKIHFEIDRFCPNMMPTRGDSYCIRLPSAGSVTSVSPLARAEP